jgi:hypothetical protein
MKIDFTWKEKKVEVILCLFQSNDLEGDTFIGKPLFLLTQLKYDAKLYYQIHFCPKIVIALYFQHTFNFRVYLTVNSVRIDTTDTVLLKIRISRLSMTFILVAVA